MTVTELLADIKLKAHMQADSTVITDAEILSLANSELQINAVPKLLALRGRYFSCFKDYSLSASKNRYRMPALRVGGRISDIVISDGTQEFALNQKHQAEISSRTGYHIDNNDIVFRSTFAPQNPGGTMRVLYPCRPPTMVLSATQYLVTAVGASSLTVSPSPTINSVVCMQNANSPFTPIAPQMVAQDGVGTLVDPDDLKNGYAERFQVGDVGFIGHQTTNVPLPIELHDWLSMKVALRIESFLGHKEEAQLMKNQIDDVEKSMFALLAPRSEDSDRVITDKETLGWRTW